MRMISNVKLTFRNINREEIGTISLESYKLAHIHTSYMIPENTHSIEVCISNDDCPCSTNNSDSEHQSDTEDVSGTEHKNDSEDKDKSNLEK